MGWYYDETCLAPVPSEWVDEQTNQIQPGNSGVWLSNHTYYAKIDPDYTSLTINTLGCVDIDEDQIFIFTIKGVSDNCADINLNVTVVGNSAIRVDNLPIGDYTVTELTAWSYRYTPDAVTKTIALSVNQSSNSLTFSHIRTTTQWLDGNDSKKNDFN